MAVEDGRATLGFYNSAAQFSVTSLVAVAVVQFSILLLLEGKAGPIDFWSFVSLYLSLSIAYGAVVVLGIYLIYNYIIFAHKLECARDLLLLTGIRGIDNTVRDTVGESRWLRGQRVRVLQNRWSRILFPALYLVISVWLPFSVWYL